MSNRPGISQWFNRQRAPITLVWVALLVISAVVTFFAPTVAGAFLFDPTRPHLLHTFLTYGFIAGFGSGFGIIFFVFLIMWVLQVGGSVESDLGPGRFIALLLGCTLIGSFSWYIAASQFGVRATLAGAIIPQAAISVTWCVRNAQASVTLMGFLSLQAKWLAWLLVVMVFTTYGFGFPIMGIAACLPLLVAALYADNRIPGLSYGYRTRREVNSNPGRGFKPPTPTYFDDVKNREKERAEKEKLRKLLEGSLDDK